MHLKILLIGSRGRMGQAIQEIAKNNNSTIIAACDAGMIRVSILAYAM